MTSPVLSKAPWRAVSVCPGTDRSLVVRFVDGTTGRVDLGCFLAGRDVEGTVFEALRDDCLFAQVIVADGAVRWPNGADLSPDAMYDSIRATGSWTVS